MNDIEASCMMLLSRTLCHRICLSDDVSFLFDLFSYLCRSFSIGSFESSLGLLISFWEFWTSIYLKQFIILF